MSIVNWEPSRKVSVLGTGGTICSCDGQGRKPVYSPKTVAARIADLQGDSNLTFREVMRKDSTDLEPCDMVRIATAIHEEIEAGADGIVLLCGTDNLAQTGAALHYLIQHSPIPIVLTGAMTPIDDPDSDVPTNFVDAVRLARSDFAGHLIAFHGRILHPCHTRKRSATHSDAFASAGAPQIAKVDGKRIKLLHDPPRWREEGHVRATFAYDARVTMHYLDMNDEPDSFERFDHLAGLRGLVLVALGTGGIRKNLLPCVSSLRKTGLALAVVSAADAPCIKLDQYEVGLRLLEAGVIPCEDLLPHAASAKLRWALSTSPDPEQVRDVMLQPVDKDMSRTVFKDLEVTSV